MTSPHVPPMQASKWLKNQALIDTEEMVSLFQALEPFTLYLVGCVTPKDKGELSQRDFLDLYHHYICQLRDGIAPDLNHYRQAFSAAMTVTDDVIHFMPLPGDKQLIRITKPVVQLQAHTMNYTKDDGKFRSMAHGTNNISWGLQFSYPQLFQNPESGEIVKVDATFPNSELFRKLQKWIREHTIPTPFIVDGVSIHTPQRLGKQCLKWIQQHPHLKDIHVNTR